MIKLQFFIIYKPRFVLVDRGWYMSYQENAWSLGWLVDWVCGCSAEDFQRFLSILRLPLELTDFQIGMIVFNKPKDLEELSSAVSHPVDRESGMKILSLLTAPYVEPELPYVNTENDENAWWLNGVRQGCRVT